MQAFENLNKISNSEELSQYLDEKLKDYPPILERTFKNLQPSASSTDQFRIMQWNILARALCPTGPYKGKKTPLFVYDWSKYRLWRTLQEMNRFSCDIICLEEADVYEELKPYMDLLGYASVFCPKYRSPCLKFANNVGPDGQAVFYRKSMFQVVTFSCEKVITKGHVNNQSMLIIDLKHKPSGNLLTLVCLHLKAFPDSAKVREHQAKFVLKAVARQCTGFNIENHPIIITGDLNGTPAENFYKLFTKDEVVKNLEDAYTVGVEGKKEPTIVFFDHMERKFSLEVDYVFYNRRNLELCGLLELPRNDELIEEEGLPNARYSSDHLSLVCDFKFLPHDSEHFLCF